MPQAEHLEIITSPFRVYVAAVGTPFPDVAAAPSALWTLLGEHGERSMAENGVTVSHGQTVNEISVYGSTGPVKAVRTKESLKVKFTLLDLSPEMYSYAIGNRTITDSGAQVGSSGNKSVQLYKGLDVAEVALLVRGNDASTEIAAAEAQFEIPRAYMSGNPAPVFSKGGAAGLELEFSALEDYDAATVADRFGRFKVYTAAARASASESVSPSASASPSASVSPSASISPSASVSPSVG